MGTVASRDLRNHTSEILRRVRGGARVTVTVNGEPVAELGPVRNTRRATIGRAALIELLTSCHADPRLRTDLDALGAETTDDLGPPA